MSKSALPREARHSRAVSRKTSFMLRPLGILFHTEFSCLLIFSVIALASSGGCEKPSLTGNGVVAVVGQSGLGDGDFSYPRAITLASDGKVFVADKSGRVQRFSAQGHFERSWHMPERRAGKPIGMTVHPDGRLFVADTHYSRVVIFDRDGRELGRFGEQGDGPGQFRLVTDVAIDSKGFVYVAEYGGNDRISKFTPQGRFIKTFGEAPIDGLRLSRPAGLDIDAEQTLWVADACNHRIVRFSLEGELLGTFGKVGEAAGELRWPYDINVCADGSLLVTEFGNSRLQWFDTEGNSLKIWGGSGRKPGELYSPWGAIESADGMLYIVDSLNNRLQIVRL